MRPSYSECRDMAHALRFLAADAVQKANSGHPGMPMGMADVATVLFTRFLKYDASAPDWPDRDRFILSAGHGSMLLYSLGYVLGYKDIPIEQIKRFRQLGAITAGHPEYGHISLAETTTGPLGQGLANAVGFALAEKMLSARYGRDVVDHRTYVIAGDGCLMEGLSQEAISLAGHWQLHKLIVLWDDNAICIDGNVSLASSEDQLARFHAAGWKTTSVDGHDHEAIAQALQDAQHSDAPVLIACRTIIGFGSPKVAGTEKAHGAPLGEAELIETRQALGWTSPPFEISDPLLAAWRDAGRQGLQARLEWEKRRADLPKDIRSAFEQALAGSLPDGWHHKLDTFKQRAIESKTAVATRKASQNVLATLAPALPTLIGGSADLTHSNLTLVSGMDVITAGDPAGQYIHYGVREHGMAAIMNGLALHGGFIPYGGTFLVFSDYARPAIRMAALMRIRVIYVMTHDSIGLGEDGPTHQPVEHLASLRAMPNLWVFRPADAVETAECWHLALERADGPSLLALSRQSLPCVRTQPMQELLSRRGGYVLSDCTHGGRHITLLATGSEVHLALDAQQNLAEHEIRAAVVSMPCHELFDMQSLEYRRSVLGTTPRIAIEAAASFGWERYVGDNGCIIGLNRFGASAPASELYTYFGITTDHIVEAAQRLVVAA